jgi:uncharacterized protein YlzI (FlbEa/FlbD family)
MKIISREILETITIEYGKSLIVVEKYDNSQYRFYWSNGSDRTEMVDESWEPVLSKIKHFLESNV